MSERMLPIVLDYIANTGRGRTNLIPFINYESDGYAEVGCVSIATQISSTRRRVMEEQSAREEEEMRVCIIVAG